MSVYLLDRNVTLQVQKSKVKCNIEILWTLKVSKFASNYECNFIKIKLFQALLGNHFKQHFMNMILSTISCIILSFQAVGGVTCDMCASLVRKDFTSMPLVELL